MLLALGLVLGTLYLIIAGRQRGPLS